MSILNKNNSFSTIFDITQKIGAPSLEDAGNIPPMVLLSVILIAVSLLLPCLVWFVRNFMRIILKKNYEKFNRSIKWILLFCLILFITSIILIVLAVKGII